MTGGVIQLSAVGKQDIHLTSKPQITLFKSVFRRHTNFAMEPISQPFETTVDFDKRITAKILRKADLLSSVYFHFKLPSLSIPSGSTFVGWTNSLGHAIIDYVELQIGGQLIDKHYGIWMEIWDELTLGTDKRNAKDLLIGRFANVTALETNASAATEYFVPLLFTFNRNFALALPLIALQFHSIEIIFKLRPFSELVTFDGSTAPTAVSITSADLICEFIYLDEGLRPRYAQDSHVHLIEQLQFNEEISISAVGTVAKNIKAQLPFNHPLKELHWVLIEDASKTNNDWFNFSQRTTTTNQISNARLLLDGQERFEKRSELYFRLIQPLQHHSRTTDKHVYMYSFAYDPEPTQPSGTLNASRFDSIELQMEIVASNPATNLLVYAVNYNFLIFKNGMIAIAYSS